MSVDYHVCNCCGEAHYEEYIGSCSECGKRICTYCLVNDDIESEYASDYNAKNKSGISSKYCPYCNNIEVDNYDLLLYLLSKYNIDKQELINEYLNQKS